MPQANYYTVEITAQIREGHHNGPREALEHALAKLDIDSGLIVSARVFRRPEGVVNPERQGS